MSRPPLEVADIIRAAGQTFIDRSSRWLTARHRKVLRHIESCRTAALGGHLDQCSRCGYSVISFNSCRDRHCPKCQSNARERWIKARTAEVLPTRYAHVVFTLPRRLAPLALQNKRLVYNLLFRLSAETLLEVARDPKHLGAEIGFFSVLHTWNQKMEHHPHVHCVAPSGGISPDNASWVRPPHRFFLPVKVLGRVFRGKFNAALKVAHARHKLRFHGELQNLSDKKAFHSLLRQTFAHDWVVYCKRPFGGPEHVLAYLGRYTHRVAISNSRRLSMADGKVTFRWRDSAHGNRQQTMTLTLEEFLRRFLLHLLPARFVRIRNFGFLANRKRATLLPVCLHLLGCALEPPDNQAKAEGVEQVWICPECGGSMMTMMLIDPADVRLRSPPTTLVSSVVQV